MKKTILLSIIIVTITFNMYSQNHYIGIKGGVNLTSVINEDYSYHSGPTSHIGSTFGITYEYLFNELYSLGIDCIYSQKGFCSGKSYSVTDEDGYSLGSMDRAINNYDYISVPIKFGINTDIIFIKVGIVPSYLLKSTIESGIHIDGYQIPPINTTESINRFDLASIIELGIKSNITDKMQLFIPLSYQRSFTNTENHDFCNSIVRHHGLSLSIGINYLLSK